MRRDVSISTKFIVPPRLMVMYSSIMRQVLYANLPEAIRTLVVDCEEAGHKLTLDHDSSSTDYSEAWTGDRWLRAQQELIPGKDEENYALLHAMGLIGKSSIIK